LAHYKAVPYGPLLAVTHNEPLRLSPGSLVNPARAPIPFTTHLVNMLVHHIQPAQQPYGNDVANRNYLITYQRRQDQLMYHAQVSASLQAHGAVERVVALQKPSISGGRCSDPPSVRSFFAVRPPQALCLVILLPSFQLSAWSVSPSTLDSLGSGRGAPVAHITRGSVVD
jgi:hypothetical protein